jgi:hypothetical protein
MGTLLDLASLVVVPSGYKEDKIYSVVPTDGSGDLDFTRASDATRVNSAGLIEKVRTNLFLQSEEFDNSPWFTSGATLTANQPDPFGGNNAFLVEFGGATTDAVSQNVSMVSGIAYTLSVYIKGVDLTALRLLVGSNLVVVSDQVINGTWVRVSSTQTAGSSASLLNQIRAGNSAGESFFIYGAQLEVSDFGATDYIPTTSSAVSVGMTADVPRLDYLGSSCPRLLLEPQRTNLVTFSEQFDNAAWTKIGVTVTANQETSPDGNTSADYVQYSGAGTELRQSIPSTTAGTISVYVKGTAGETIKYGVTGDEGIYTLTGDWQRLQRTFAGTSTEITINTYSGATARNIYIWGAQIEVGSYATSYIPTLGTSVTRVADAASKTGISSLIGQTEGVIFLDFIAETPSEVRRVSLSNADVNNRILIAHQANGKIQFFGNESVSTQFSFETTQVYTKGDKVKVALAYKQNDFAGYINGVQMFTDNSGNVATSLFNFSFTDSNLSVNRFIGSVNQAILFKTRLSNTELAQLTTL